MERPVDPNDVGIAILSGLTRQYDAEVRMLESSSDWPSREWIERAVMSQYDRLRAEESAAGSKAMFAARSNARKSKAPPRCPLFSRTGHTAQGCKEYIVTKHDQKSGGQRTGFNGNSGGDGSGSRGRNGGGSKFKHRKGKSGNPTDAGTKPTHQGCYFCEGPHKSDICARTVWTPRPLLRRPPMVPCTADTSVPPTAISAQDYS